MNKYNMIVELNTKSSFEVEANNLEEAKEKAIEEFTDYELTAEGMDDRNYEVYEENSQKATREFTDSGNKFGKCIILKQTRDKDYSLIYSPKVNEYIVVNMINAEKGYWGSGSYFGSNLQGALEHFNTRNKIVEKKYKESKERE